MLAPANDKENRTLLNHRELVSRLIMIVLARVSSMEYKAICTALRKLQVVKEFGEDGLRN